MRIWREKRSLLAGPCSPWKIVKMKKGTRKGTKIVPIAAMNRTARKARKIPKIRTIASLITMR